MGQGSCFDCAFYFLTLLSLEHHCFGSKAKILICTVLNVHKVCCFVFSFSSSMLSSSAGCTSKNKVTSQRFLTFRHLEPRQRSCINSQQPLSSTEVANKYVQSMNFSSDMSEEKYPPTQIPCYCTLIKCPAAPCSGHLI